MTAIGVITKPTERNTITLTKKGHTIATHAGNQPVIVIQVFEGEGAMTQDVDLLGKSHLDEGWYAGRRVQICCTSLRLVVNITQVHPTSLVKLDGSEAKINFLAAGALRRGCSLVFGTHMETFLLLN